jgi:hypothetical protein
MSRSAYDLALLTNTTLLTERCPVSLPIEGELLCPASDDDIRLTTIAFTMIDQGFPKTDVDFILSLLSPPTEKHLYTRVPALPVPAMVSVRFRQ